MSILEEVESAIANADEWYWGGVDYCLSHYNPFSRLPHLDVTIYDQKTGRAGDWATDTYVILLVENKETGEEVYLRKTGYYRSYDGTEWDGPLTVVKPATKTVTVWAEADEYDSFEYDDSFDNSYSM